MRLGKIAPRSAAQQRKLAALWKQLENDEKRTQATRDTINKFLSSEQRESVEVASKSKT